MTQFTFTSKYDINDKVFCKMSDDIVIQGSVHRVLWKSHSADSDEESFSYVVVYSDGIMSKSRTFDQNLVFSSPTEAFNLKTREES